MTEPKPEQEEQEHEREESGDTDSNPSTDVKDTILLYKEQMKMRRQEQDFIRHSLHTREIGEVYQLSSIQRQGLAEAQALAGQVYFARIKEIQKLSETMMHLAEQYAEKLKAPPPPPPSPPPPPDYPSMVMAALGAIQQISSDYLIHKTDMMRLVTGDSNRETPGRLTAQAPSAKKETQADLPLGHPLKDPPAPVNQPATPFSRFRAKALSMSDAEIAQGISSPEGMMALIQKLFIVPATASDGVTKVTDDKDEGK